MDIYRYRYICNGSGEWGGESPWVAPSTDDVLLEVRVRVRG